MKAQNALLVIPGLDSGCSCFAGSKEDSGRWSSWSREADAGIAVCRNRFDLDQGGDSAWLRKMHYCYPGSRNPFGIRGNRAFVVVIGKLDCTGGEVEMMVMEQVRPDCRHQYHERQHGSNEYVARQPVHHNDCVVNQLRSERFHCQPWIPFYPLTRVLIRTRPLPHRLLMRRLQYENFMVSRYDLNAGACTGCGYGC